MTTGKPPFKASEGGRIDILRAMPIGRKVLNIKVKKEKWKNGVLEQ